MFDICVQFLQGRVVAARPTDSDRLEWPIEPARLFMAMVAGYYEFEGDDSQRNLLEWLESLAPPRILFPTAFAREVCTTFVVVNDRYGSKDDPLSRGKQPRTFPSGFVGDEISRYRFEATPTDDQRVALNQLLSQVVRLGHSSSLVCCWAEFDVAAEFEIPHNPRPIAGHHCIEPHSADKRSLRQASNLRVASPGTLRRLDQFFNRDLITQYDKLAQEAFAIPATKASEAAKKKLKESFPHFAKHPPASRNPIIQTRHAYINVQSRQAARPAETAFDPGLVTLTILDGNTIGLESTATLCQALRGLVLSQHDGKAPTWITGHDNDGRPTKSPHLAFVPLPHVGKSTSTQVASSESQHPTDKTVVHRSRLTSNPTRSKARRPNIFDGHLLGLALILPRDLENVEKGRGLAHLLYQDDGSPREIILRCGSIGDFRLCREERERPPLALQPETWTRPSHLYASVTPIVLDRFPKTDPKKNRSAWLDEVSQIIRESCSHIGIDSSDIVQIRIGKHGFVAGVPSAVPAKGFRLLPASGGKPPRTQVHAVIEFARPVHGPVLIGAGRFRGYGFCKPVEHKS